MTKHTVTAALAALMAVACGGSGPSAPPAPLGSPRPALLEAFQDARPGDPRDPVSSDFEPMELADVVWGLGEELIVESGRLDGQIGEVSLSQDADDHIGFVDSFDEYSYLMASFSARTDDGVAMLILNVDEGWNSPLFTEGSLHGESRPLDPESLETLSLEELEALFLGSSVMGCSGDSFAEIDWDEMATRFDLTASQHADDSSVWTVTADVDFIDPVTGDELSVSGQVDLTRSQ